MKITVALAGSLNKYIDGKKEVEINIWEGTTIEDLIYMLEIPEKYYSFVMINGCKVPRTKELSNNDKIVIFPLVAGG